MLVNKKVPLKLKGLDGNAFSIMGAFQHAAQKEMWTEDEINLVLNEAMTSDYKHLLKVIQEHCK